MGYPIAGSGFGSGATGGGGGICISCTAIGGTVTGVKTRVLCLAGRSDCVSLLSSSKYSLHPQVLDTMMCYCCPK